MSQRLENSLRFCGKSDVGCIRAKNEDCMAWDARLGFAIIADGMGGANAGDVASQITAETVLMEVREGLDAHPHDQSLVDNGEKYTRASIMLCRSLQKANSVVLRIATDQPECNGMGSTALAVLLYDNRISVGHIGDSRLYLMRNGQLTQLTQDHTVLQQVMSSALNTKNPAQIKFNKNIVTRAVGVSENLNIDVIEQPTLPGDLFLMCSDGLSDMLSDDEIRERLAAGTMEGDLSQDLVDFAIKKGGHDNISVILIEVLKPYPSTRNLLQRVMDRLF